MDEQYLTEADVDELRECEGDEVVLWCARLAEQHMATRRYRSETCPSEFEEAVECMILLLHSCDRTILGWLRFLRKDLLARIQTRSQLQSG
jgi:hypothetical protein